ncbi:YbaY family lipoprotein [Sinosporangium siamense]|uniref:Uncharacterized protein n=1 Tax=Sinosporangium siamense TaxID=1367973 RepID=A0A919RRS6_9ACTN|nr:YbaY family lipoprotein [Sinosporangium siamense]GII97331.1 hypothetical protein Ssi02_75620 [Sinosporangium siamense]
MTERRTVTGRIAFPSAIGAGAAAVHVLVEDVSRADAAARVVAAIDLPLGHALGAGETLSFSLAVPVESDMQRLSVRVHVDRSRDGTIAEGDWISTAAHPVLTQGAGDHVDIEVRPV